MTCALTLWSRAETTFRSAEPSRLAVSTLFSSTEMAEGLFVRHRSVESAPSGSTVTSSGRVWVGSRMMRSGRPVSAVGSRLLVTVTFTCAKTVLSPGT